MGGEGGGGDWLCQWFTSNYALWPWAYRCLVKDGGGKHDSGVTSGPSVWDVASTVFYGLVPLILILAAGGPTWAAILVAVASAAIGFWRT